MGQQKASLLRIGQLVKLDGGALFPTRFVKVARQDRAVTWCKVVAAPEVDLIGAETTIEGCETFHGIGWYCVSSLTAIPTFEDLS